MKKKIFSIAFLGNLLLYIAIFIASLNFPSDPDLGWHLKYGEYFFRNGAVLKENLFSQLMPDYIWNNSSWLTDLISYSAFKLNGFIGLSLLGALTVTLTFFFLGKAAKLNLFEKSIIFPLLFYLVTPVNEISFRGQMISMLLLGVLYFILSKYEDNKRFVLLLIPIFMLWGNLHGQYILGLGIFFIWVSVYLMKEFYLSYRTKFIKLFSDNKLLILSLLGSSLAILVNPYGIGVYKEALGHFDDPFQQSITEFLAPADFSAVWWHLLFMGVVMIIGVALLGTGKKNLDKAPFYAPSFILYIFTFWIRRYAWPLYYSSVFLLQPVVKFFEPDNKKYSGYISLIFAILFLLLALYIKYPFSEMKQMNWDNYCKKSVNCSPLAAENVIRNKLNNDKLLTTYDYGGWLIWNYSLIKPTIDGRMHLWRDKKGFSGFEYYYPIEQNINGKDIDKTIYNTVLTSRKKPIFNRLAELTAQGKWKAIYADDYSAVFIRL